MSAVETSNWATTETCKHEPPSMLVDRAKAVWRPFVVRSRRRAHVDESDEMRFFATFNQLALLLAAFTGSSLVGGCSLAWPWLGHGDGI